MSKLRIEENGGADLGPCADCAGTTRSISGLVYKDESAYAIYLARWTEGHAERGITIVLIIGKWKDFDNISLRKTIGVDCKMGKDRPGFWIVDAASIPWAHSDLSSNLLTREEVLKDAIKDEAFQILDYLVYNDKRVKAFLLTGLPHKY